MEPGAESSGQEHPLQSWHGGFTAEEKAAWSWGFSHSAVGCGEDLGDAMQQRTQALSLWSGTTVAPASLLLAWECH